MSEYITTCTMKIKASSLTFEDLRQAFEEHPTQREEALTEWFARRHDRVCQETVTDGVYRNGQHT